MIEVFDDLSQLNQYTLLFIALYPLFDSRIAVSLCGYLSVGQLNNGKRPACFARTVCLRIGPFRTGNRAGAGICSLDLAIGNKRSTTMTTFALLLLLKHLF